MAILSRWKYFCKHTEIVCVLMVVVLAFLPNSSRGQELRNEDFLYRKDIATPMTRVSASLISGSPFIGLHSNQIIRISFDWLTRDQEQLTYQIVHCDRDWNPSDLYYNDYIEGFEDNYLDPTGYSSAKYTDYTEYELRLPNEDIQFKLSGNYLVHIFFDDKPLMTRRFVLYENLVKGRVEITAGMSFNYTQTLYVDLNIEDYRIRNPKNEIRLTAMQNGRWDNAISNVKPLFVSMDNIRFDRADAISFPAGKEFRTLDIRTINRRGQFIESTTEYVDGWEIVKQTDQPGFNHSVNNGVFDHDGQFALLNDDNFGFNHSEYVDVVFSLEDDNDLPIGPYYVVGQFNDWKCEEKYAMHYDDEKDLFVASIKLRQGLYDYAYATMDENFRADLTSVDGSWRETNNQYTVIVYQNTFSPVRYDRVIYVWNNVKQ